MELAETLMMEFAKNTGLTTSKNPRRYLWTDAFAVCNFIELYKQTKNNRYIQLAKDLVQQVHSILGKHRKDDDREGWLSKDPKRPTGNGLRIGKKLPERQRGKPLDERLEWERDGQYFHYLTKWMIALIHMGKFLKEKKYTKWAVDLVKASLAFICDDRMYWKMSTDLSRPLISSMGQHDPLDGYVAYKIVNEHAEQNLSNEVKKMHGMANSIRLETMDPLGIGGMLVDAYRLYKMNEDINFVSKIIAAAGYGLQFLNPNAHGLAFRELGLAIGLEASKRMKKLEPYWQIKHQIIDYWIDHRQWKEHEDINQVMLATSLIPDQFLEI